MKFLIIILFISSFQLKANEKYSFILGAGGEPSGNTTIFDADLKNTGAFYNNSDWHTSVSLNGSHKKTEEIINTSFSKAKNYGGFTETNYKTILADIKDQILSGKITSGDQLLLNFNTHGAMHSTWSGEKSHRIAFGQSSATDLVNLNGASTISMDSIQEIINLAEEKNIKLAILDFSCFSGNTLKLAGPHTCIISAAGENQFGYIATIDLKFSSIALAFSGIFTKKMEKGKNLEEIFLKARAEGSCPDYPMISTPEGRSIDQAIYNLMSPYLSYNTQHFPQFSEIYDGVDYSKATCKTAQQYNELIAQLESYKKLLKVGSVELYNFYVLLGMLERYHKFQLQYEAKLKASLVSGNELLKIIHEKYPNQEELFNFETGAAILSTDFDSSINEYKKYSGVSSYFNEQLERLQTKKKIINEILNTQEGKKLKKVADELKTAQKNESKTYSLANDVALEAKKVYGSIYKKIQNKESNPCRDFVL